MRPDPIDFESPLGISKREWVKVLGVNLALLLIVYAVALICTLCGSDMFLLNFHSDDLQRIEETLWSWNIYPLITIAYATIETCVMASYVKREIVKWYFPVLLFATKAIVNVIFTACGATLPSFLPTAINAVFLLIVAIVRCRKEKWWKVLIRISIALAASLLLNELIGVFRTKFIGFWKLDYSSSALFALSIEYILALVLTLEFLALLITWEKGEKACNQNPDAGGSSPTLKKWSRKNSPQKNNLSPKLKRKIALLKAKVIAIQTVALVIVAALPLLAGRPVEFSLLYASFCLTRIILGFSHSVHFKSELACTTIGALTFWGLTFLAPSAEASIIMSLVYGAGLALVFRLYWELHDLMMYHKAAKTDRYAMFYTAFKGNLDPRHIRGVMRLRGFIDEDLIKAVQMYMAKEKVDYIAQWMNMPLRSVDRKLTETADAIYRMR